MKQDKLLKGKLPKRIPLSITARTKVYPYLMHYQMIYGVSPSLGDIADAFGKTRQWAGLAVEELKKQKLIKKKKNARREIQLIIKK